MPKYLIPVTSELFPLCEHICGGALPHVPGDKYLVVNTDPEVQFSVGVVPIKGVIRGVPAIVLLPEVVKDISDLEFVAKKTRFVVER